MGKLDGLRTAYSFDDLTLVPNLFEGTTRAELDLSSNITRKIVVKTPLISSPMIDVTESDMAIAIARAGGVGIVHRFMPIERQVEEVLKVKRADNFVIQNPYHLSPEQKVYEAKRLMIQKSISGIPIVEEGILVGLVTARDLTLANDEEFLRNVMTPKERLILGSPSTSFEEAKEVMYKNRVEKLPLVDENSLLCGLITMRDIRKVEQYKDATRDKNGRLVVGAAIGAVGDYIERASELIKAGVDFLDIDVAHGHSSLCLRAIKEIKENFDVEVMAGAIDTPSALEDLVKAGADAVRVGVGPGSICKTRRVTGFGVPLASAIEECNEKRKEFGTYVPIIADGGIRESGDLVKAFALGADAAIIGRLFAPTSESPAPLSIDEKTGMRFKLYRGMASRDAFKARRESEGKNVAMDEFLHYAPEGVPVKLPYTGGSVHEVISVLKKGVQSGLSYAGARNLQELRENAKFRIVTKAGVKEGTPHALG